MTNDAGPGFYGKLPAVGDFVTRRLPRTFTEPWDEWLQRALASSREQFADGWLDVYLTSPIWRFVLKPGVCGNSTWAGAMMPSVDRVGRYFPLTVACTLGNTPNPFIVASETGDWFANAESALLSALDEETTEVESLDRAIAALGDLTLGGDNVSARFEPPPPGTPWRIGIERVEAVDLALLPALDALTQTQYGSYSLWWTAGSEHVSPSLLTCTRLPAAQEFAAMLGGGFAQRSWHVSPRASPQVDVPPPPMDVEP